jgi:hypothetical protein
LPFFDGNLDELFTTSSEEGESFIDTYYTDDAVHFRKCKSDLIKRDLPGIVNELEQELSEITLFPRPVKGH